MSGYECPNEHTINKTRDTLAHESEYWITCGDRELSRLASVSDERDVDLWRVHVMDSHRIEVKDAEIARLHGFVADVKHALRPYNGTGYHDMDGRTTAEVAAEVGEVVRAYEAAVRGEATDTEEAGRG